MFFHYTLAISGLCMYSAILSIHWNSCNRLFIRQLQDVWFLEWSMDVWGCRGGWLVVIGLVICVLSDYYGVWEFYGKRYFGDGDIRCLCVFSSEK